MKPVDLFTRDVHTFWATTYQFDLKLFDQFLLRRLGSQPLNAVVLADEDDITDALAGLTEIDEHVAANANRRYLLRGVRPASGGRFHPKTYFFSSRRRTTLLIGSGNLTRSGLDRGREVFCAYDATNAAHVGVIRAWAAWIAQLVAERSDEQLRRRCDHLRTVVSCLVGPRDEGEFVTNRKRPIVEALEAAAPQRVAELHVTAPYFDEHATALSELLARLRPTDAAHIYLGARTNVDGRSLRRVLDGASCAVVAHRFDPAEFVHAKLIGLTGPDGSGILLCGSPNLSRAALTLTHQQAGSRGNCEAAVLRSGSARDVVEVFRPPGTTLVPVDLEALESIAFESEEPSSRSLEVRLLSAEATSEDHILVHADASDLDRFSIAWDGPTSPLALITEGRTATPLSEDDTPLVVWLVNERGDLCSNRVVLDDPQALEDMLGERGGPTDRPAELADEDERSDLVGLLNWAHQQFIFDLDDTPAVRHANNAQEQQRDEDDTDFWDRYVREELTYDTRSQTYRPLSGARTLAGADLLLREIEAMLNAAPNERRLRIVRSTCDDDSDTSGTGHAWSFSARQRVRARNLLRRWARALADPRHAWLSVDAPAINYTALLDVLVLIWLGDALDDETMIELLEEMWSGLFGAQGRKGFLDVADERLAEEVVAEVSDDTRQLAAGLAYVALHNDMPWTEYVYAWQPFLQRGIATRLFAAGDLSMALAEALLEQTPPTSTAIDELIMRRAYWVDDRTWGQRIAAELGLQRVAIVPRAGYKNVDLVVSVAGLPEPGRDSRTVVLARRAMALKRSDHVMIEAGSERILLRLGEYAHARVDGEIRTSVSPIESDRLRAVEAQGGSLAELLGLAA